MRVLVYGLVGTNRGGIETYLLKMNQHISRHTIFDYVVEGNECIHEEEINSYGGEVYHVSSRSDRKQYIRDNVRLFELAKRTHEAVYFNLSSICDIPLIKKAITAGYRVYVHAHNADFVAANNDLFHRIAHNINKQGIKTYKIVRLTCSKPATEFMFGKHKNVIMIHNANSPERFRFDVEKRNRIKKGLGWEKQKIIGFVGRLDDQKNPLFLPEIMVNTLSIDKDTRMLIIGDGRLRKQVEASFGRYGINEAVFFTGNITNPEDYMQAMDVLVLPSIHEGLPYVAVEAQTSGLRCILSDNITQEVNITGNCQYLPLEDPVLWGEFVIKTITRVNVGERVQWCDYIKGTCFDIDTEAPRLESILSNKAE